MSSYTNVYSGEECPKDRSVLWIHHKTKNDLSSPLIAEIFNKGKWVPVSSGDSSGSGDTSTDIQIVELTYDHLPATGTLSASDLAKLDSDNCLLVMKGKYFRKTFSSDGGIDYKEIGLTTVLGGVRSIYFTASKSDGEYTIAYTYPVEANTQTQATMPLENIKVGNTTYSVPPSPMIIDGIEYDDYREHNDAYHFVPLNPQNTAAKAIQYLLSGGAVFAHVTTIRDSEGNVDSDNFYLLPLDFFPGNQEQGYAASIRFYSTNSNSGLMWDDDFVIPEG